MIELGHSYRPADVLPHRPPMVLLDAIAGYGEDWLEAEVHVGSQSPFAGAGGVPAWVGIEYMAQAVCAWASIEQVQRGEKPSVGLLLGSREYKAQRADFPLGSRLRIRVKLAWRDHDDLGAFECEITDGTGVLASAQLKVARPKDVQVLLATMSTT